MKKEYVVGIELEITKSVSSEISEQISHNVIGVIETLLNEVHTHFSDYEVSVKEVISRSS